MELNKMTSQKAQALKDYKSVYDNWAIEQKWEPLQTYQMDMPICHEDHLEAHFSSIAREVWDKYQATTQLDKIPLFVRACPEKPRHGVLESVAVHTEDECVEAVKRIGKKMIEVGELQGSIIIQPFIEAHASAVYAPNNYILIGREHDGITAGKDGLRIALPIKSQDWVTNIFSSLKIDPNLIELEFISKLKHVESDMSNIFSALHTKHYSAMDNYITQLRGCVEHIPLTSPPKGIDINGSVPNGSVTVKSIFRITCLDDIADMEEWVNKGVAEGGVVSHPDGTLLSHAAAHCRAHSVPYIVADVQENDTWTEVAGGWVTDEEGIEPQPYDANEYNSSFKEGLTVGLYYWTRMYGWLTNHFHQFVSQPMINPSETAFLGGVYVGWLINATMAVSLGEMRNARNARRGNHPAVFGTLGAVFNGKWVGDAGFVRGVKIDDGEVVHTPPQTRSNYFYTMEKTPLNMESMEYTLKWLVNMYTSGWGGSYGGPPYAASTQNALDLLLLVKKYLVDDSKENFYEVIEKANQTENNIHNCGFFFNKFMLKSTLDMGTDPDGCPSTLEHLFMPYYAAFAAVSKRGENPTDLHDNSSVMKYVLKKGPARWRKTPIFVDKDAPSILKDAINTIVAEERGELLHCGGGPNCTPTNHKFISCGHKDCSICKNHTEWLSTQAEHKQKLYFEQVLGRKYIALMDSGASYDLYPAGASVNSIDEDFLIAVCDTIANKEEPAFEIIEKAFEVLNPSMADYKVYSTTIAKYIAKKGPNEIMKYAGITDEIIDTHMKEGDE